jgi:hypothetical protein
MADSDSIGQTSIEHKRCIVCEQLLPLSRFYNARGSGGRSKKTVARCITCYNRQQCARKKERYQHDQVFRAKVRNRQRKRTLQRWGLSEPDYHRMLREQGGGCAICGTTTNTHATGRACRLAIDHNHRTGRIRSLLCGRCNQLIGLAGESQPLLRKAIAYLLRHNQNKSG